MLALLEKFSEVINKGPVAGMYVFGYRGWTVYVRNENRVQINHPPL